MNNQILVADCLEGMKVLSDNSVQLCITSPPYNVGKNHIYSDKNKQKKYENDNDLKDNYFQWLKERVSEMIRVSKYTFLNVQMLANNKVDIIMLLNSFQDYFKDVMIWSKNGQPAMEPGVLNSCFEFIFIFSKEKPDKRKFYDTSFRGTVPNLFQMKTNSRNKYAKVHRACFPVELPEMIISNFSKENDVILDPFMGLGSTALAAKKLKRNYLGFDISEEYVKIALDRLNELP